MSKPPEQRTSVIIPTWNGRDMLRLALASLERQHYPDFEVIVVDNGSDDGTDVMIQREFPRVRMVRFTENRGFAPAVNAGIVAAAGEIVILLNNDAEAEPEFVDALVAALNADPGLGSCAARVLRAEDGRIDSAGIQLGLFPSQIGHGHINGPEFSSPREVFGASGGAAAYRKEVLERVGGFDDRFFAYFEDADLACRLRLAGHRCLYVPGAVAHHLGSATARRIPDRKFHLLMRNGLFVFFQNMPLRRLLPWAPLVLLWPFIRALIDGVRLRVAATAFVDFVRGLPTLIQRRRRALAVRRVPWSEFTAALAPALTLSGQPLVPDETPAAGDSSAVRSSDPDWPGPGGRQ